MAKRDKLLPFNPPNALEKGTDRKINKDKNLHVL
jgi:hypothetical protein